MNGAGAATPERSSLEPKLFASAIEGANGVVVLTARGGCAAQPRHDAHVVGRQVDGRAPSIEGFGVLAAGTDGQDGPARAAGAVISSGTWRESSTSGGEPRRSLRRCDAFAALDAAGAIIPARSTGTNVMDVVVAVRV